MSIARLNKRGQVVEENFDGFFSDVGNFFTSALSSAYKVVKSPAEIAAEAAEKAVKTATLAANVVEIPKVIDASKAVINQTTNAAINTTSGISSGAVQEAASIVNAAKAIPSVVSDPTGAADAIIKSALEQADIIKSATALIMSPFAKKQDQAQDSGIQEEIQYVYEAPEQSAPQIKATTQDKNIFEHPIAAYFR